MTNARAGARALVSESLRLDAADPARLRVCARAANLPVALHLAQTHAVLPTLAWTLTRKGLLGAFPEKVGAALGDALAQNAAQNALLMDDLCKLAQTFASARIPFIALKGAALMALDPRGLACRQTDDIDLLFDEVDVYRARDCARALGYHQETKPPLVDYVGDVVPLSHHLPTLFSPRGTPLELHFRLGPGERHAGRFPLLPGLRRVKVSTSGREFFLDVPSESLLASHLATHVMVHHLAMAAYLPRHIQDLHLLRSEAESAAPGIAAVDQPTSFEVCRGYLAETLGWGLANGLAAPLGSPRRRVAEMLIFSTGVITLARLLRPFRLGPRTPFSAWGRVLVPSRAFLTQLYPEAAEAGAVQTLALYVRRLRRVARDA